MCTPRFSHLRTFWFAFAVLMLTVNCHDGDPRSNDVNIREKLQRLIGDSAHETRQAVTIQAIRQQLQGQYVLNAADLGGEELSMVVDVTVSSNEQILTRLYDSMALRVRDNNHWLKTIESKFSIEQSSPTIRSLRCMRVGDDALLRFDDGPWQRIGREGGFVDQTCLQTDTWIRDLINGFDDQISFEISADDLKSSWVMVRLRHNPSGFPSEFTRMPSDLDTWDILRDENDRYSHSILARYGKLLDISGHVMINSRSGLIGQSSISARVALHGDKKFIISLSFNRDIKPGDFDFVIPPHIDIKPRISVEKTLQQWRRRRSSSNTDRPSLQPRDKRKTLKTPNGR